MYGDIYARLWDLHMENKPDEVRDLFAKLLLMLDLDERIPSARLYVLRRRGIFKNTKSRRVQYSVSREATAEIEHNLAAIRPYFRVPIAT
jgi:hypothetical protein